MIICMNYTDWGKRVIAKIDYIASRHEQDDIAMATAYTEQYDEVYIMPLIPTEELINEIVLKGCRI